MTYLLESITPTRIYHKSCSHCGLNYLGKTTLEDIETYQGSGVHWQRHLKKHKAKAIHIWNSEWFYDKSIVEYALGLSTKLNIVESSDWANKKPENGLDGGFEYINKNILSKEQRSTNGKVGGKKAAEMFNNGKISAGQWWFTKEGLKARSILGKQAFKDKYPEGYTWKQSEQSLINQKKALKEINHQQGEKNSQFGTMWITNGRDNKKVKKDIDFIPEGWYKGRVTIK